MAQDYRHASLGPSYSGQALPFWPRGQSHGSRLGRSYPGSGAWAHGSRPAARGSGRGSGHGSMLPISFPLLLGLGSSTTFLTPLPIPRPSLRQIACVLPCYPRGKLKCGLSYAIFRFSKVAIFSAKYRTITPFFAS